MPILAWWYLVRLTVEELPMAPWMESFRLCRLILGQTVNMMKFKKYDSQHEWIGDTVNIQETPQCDETRFSTLQPSIDMTGIKNERWQ